MSEPPKMLGTDSGRAAHAGLDVFLSLRRLELDLPGIGHPLRGIEDLQRNKIAARVIVEDDALYTVTTSAGSWFMPRLGFADDCNRTTVAVSGNGNRSVLHMLSHQEARQAYDRIGSLQDSQAFYEDRTTSVLLRHAEFASAHNVFEFGCGTGRFARRLFEEYLSGTAHYRGVDLSPKMVRLAQERLLAYSPRAEVILTDGGPPVDEPAAAYDRFVSNYVFDLLSEEDIRAVVREAHRMLRPGGLLCLASLSTGTGPASRNVARVWGWIQARLPSVVGGCRPVDLLPFLPDSHWRVRHHAKVVAFAIPSEAVVAQRS